MNNTEHLTVKEYADLMNISTQSVYRQIKQNKLQTIKKRGMTFIQMPHTESLHNKKVKVIGLDGSQNRNGEIELLKDIVTKLEIDNKELKEKNETLVQEKTQLLIDERDRIQNIYKEKDEQLKKVLELINTKLLEKSQTNLAEIIVDTEEVIKKTSDEDVEEANIEDEDIPENLEELVELGEYLLYFGIPLIDRVKIKYRFSELYGKEKRIIKYNRDFYLNFDKYDYRDILEIEGE